MQTKPNQAHFYQHDFPNLYPCGYTILVGTLSLLPLLGLVSAVGIRRADTRIPTLA